MDAQTCDVSYCSFILSHPLSLVLLPRDRADMSTTARQKGFQVHLIKAQKIKKSQNYIILSRHFLMYIKTKILFPECMASVEHKTMYLMAGRSLSLGLG